MYTSFFGWLAFAAFIALLCTHPIRGKPFGPRLIAFFAFLIATSIGFCFVFYTYDLYSIGQVPRLSRSGGSIPIAGHGTYAFFAISTCILFGLASFWSGIYMLTIAFMRKKDAPTRRPTPTRRHVG
jgi:predicted neutral ceramidase superfamily lipid hydrolase